jgi:hypothetical protein
LAGKFACGLRIIGVAWIIIRVVSRIAWVSGVARAAVVATRAIVIPRATAGSIVIPAVVIPAVIVSTGVLSHSWGHKQRLRRRQNGKKPKHQAQ